MPNLREYNNLSDRAQVIALWKTVFGYETAHNDPDLVIDTKAQVGDRLFFVAAKGSAIVGTAMAGYDGHRGWLYAIAVHPDHRGADVGSGLVRHAESALARLGCLKINLQLVASNEATAAFYRSLGYVVEPRISMGKVLPQNAMPDKAAVTRKLISSGSPFEGQIAYSRAVVDGDWIFVSGTTGFDYASMTLSLIHI
jgi:ribosomal protein S18 acetylase RimI-like enzyme